MKFKLNFNPALQYSFKLKKATGKRVRHHVSFRLFKIFCFFFFFSIVHAKNMLKHMKT